MLRLIKRKTALANHADLVGVMASGLCLAHCLATPFVLAMTASLATCCKSSSVWWKSADYGLMALSLGAVILAAQKNKERRWVGYAMYVAWLLLFGVLVNEKFGIVPLLEEAIYLPSLGLAALHIYNRKNCPSSETKC